MSRAPNVLFSELVKTILTEGVEVGTRNSVTKRIIGQRIQFDTCPLVTVRRTAWKNALREMEWFLSGSTRLCDLHPAVQKWWLPWANPEGVVPFNYSHQFRNYGGQDFGKESDKPGLDQIEWLLGAVRDHPFSRRNLITTWNTRDMIDPANPITNCHGTIIHVFGRLVSSDPYDYDKPPIIDLLMVQRSCDTILGVPHNWIQYWAFLLWLARRTGHKPGSLIWFGDDVHVYQSHEPVAKRIVDVGGAYMDWPSMIYNPTSADFKADDFSIDDDYPPAVLDKVEMIV